MSRVARDMIVYTLWLTCAVMSTIGMLVIYDVNHNVHGSLGDFSTERCSGRVVRAPYHAGEVHVSCDLNPPQRLDIVLPKGMPKANRLYLARHHGGRLVGRIIKGADY